MQRLGRNQGRYCGETIFIEKVLLEIERETLRRGWGQDLVLSRPEGSLKGYHRRSGKPRRRLYLSTGIHGDEPAGPLAIARLLAEDQWPEDTDVWLCPCLNPGGFALNQRENASGIDLNRDYRHRQSEEVRAHVAWLESLPQFDLTLILHEDWEAGGFYLYELNPERRPSLAEEIVSAVAPVCPIENGELVDGWAAQAGIIRPVVDPEERPQWPEAIYLIRHKTPLSYTLEAPSDFPLETRVAAHQAAVRAALNAWTRST